MVSALCFPGLSKNILQRISSNLLLSGQLSQHDFAVAEASD